MHILTRKYLLNMKRPQTAAVSKGVLNISYMMMFWKITTFGYFGRIRPFFSSRIWLKNVSRHIYAPRTLILAYNQVSMTFRSKVLARTSPYFRKNKEVFVKHEQAPTAPKLEGVCMGFCRFKIYFLWKALFLANLTTSGRVFFDRNGQKAHLRTNTFHLSL